jgi:hypothetical protein
MRAPLQSGEANLIVVVETAAMVNDGVGGGLKALEHPEEHGR